MLIRSVLLLCAMAAAAGLAPSIIDRGAATAAARQAAEAATGVPRHCRLHFEHELDPTMSPARRLEITAVIRPSRISAGGDAAILLAMTQPGPDELITPHPLLSTEALTLHVRLPSGDERIVRSPPGRLSTPRRTAKVALLPGVTQKFGVAVAGFLPAITAGTYCIVVEYEWAPGRVWRSEALTLVVG